MGEGQQEAIIDRPAQRIGVCVGKEQRGIHALKWALQKAIPPQGHVYLLHIKPPLLWIPNPMGGKLPVDQVNPVMVKKFEEDRFLDTKKHVENYVKLCHRNKVTSELCYSENDSIQKEIVDQISKLGITILVLEISSQNALTKALKKESISAYVAKNSPDFCSVIVVRKGKLYSVKDATRSASFSSISTTIDGSSSMRSETSTSSASTSFSEPIEDQLTMVTGIQNSGVMQSESLCTTSHLRLLQSASMDISRKPLEWMMSHGSDNAGLQSPATNVMVRNNSALPPSRCPGSAPATLFHQGQHRVDHWQRHDNDKARSLIGLLNQTSVPNGYPGETSPPTMHMEDLGSLATLLAANGSLHEMMDSSQLLPNKSDCDALSQLSLEMENSTGSIALESQTSLNETESVPMDSSPALNKEVLPSREFDLLQRQLNEAKQSSQQWAQQEAERQANNFKMAEEMVENARKKISEYERHRDAALNEARVTSQKASYYQKELDRAAAMLQAALQDQEILKERLAEEIRRHAKELDRAAAMLQAALQDQKILKERLAEEIRRHAVTRNDLETTRSIADVLTITVELNEQELEAERCRCKEISSKLEEVNKQLEKERQLREGAEERASQDAIAKREALMALRKEQKKYTEYSFLELQIATDDFHEANKLGQGGYGPVYRGKLHHTTVAIKVLATEGSQGHEEFQKEVELLSRIHHPHMVMLLGACPDNGCIVYEYMANGSLEDRLNCRDDTPPLPWYVRFQICLEVATALLFLHSLPQPVVHRDLKPGNILLDHHFVSKISDVGLAKLVANNISFSVTMYKDTVLVGTWAYMDPDYQRTGVVSCESDVYALGIIMLQLLTGQQAVGVTHLVEQAVDNGQLEEVLDKSAGEWPLAEAMSLACLSLQCTEPRRKHRPNLETKLLPELERIQNVAGIAAANIACAGSFSSGKMPVIPGSFFCPIYQEIMQNPHIAADGFTYEYDAIKLWLEEHDTSPMTNLVLSHDNLMPNLSLRSAIKEWYDNGLLLD